MTEPASRAQADLLQARPLLVRTGIVLLGLLGAAGAIGLLFRETLIAASCAFVGRWGAWGIALGFFIPDATNLPLPHDLFLMMAATGGLPVWQIVVAGTVGSVAGGCVAFAVSPLVRRLPYIARQLEGRGAAVSQVVERYGAIAVAVGAITPLPYSLMAWAAGILGMRFRVFLAVSMLRVVRVAGYFALIKAGLAATGVPAGCDATDLAPSPAPIAAPVESP